MSAANSCRSALVCTLLVLPFAASSQSISTRLPISLDADSSELDRRNNRLVFSGVRITQGSIGIEAEQGRTLLGGDGSEGFRDSIWSFEGDVTIDVDATSIWADSAELTFKDHRLSRAVVAGDPARFRNTGAEDGKVTTGQAGNFEYDLPAGMITFSGDAVINEGSNTVAGDTLIYDLNKQLVTARGGVGDDGRVKLTIVPEEIEGDGADDEESP